LLVYKILVTVLTVG